MEKLEKKIELKHKVIESKSHRNVLVLISLSAYKAGGDYEALEKEVPSTHPIEKALVISVLTHSS